MFVVDAADTARFDEARAALAALLAHADLAGVPVLLLANKSDLATAQDAEHVRTALAVGPAQLAGRPYAARGISALDGSHVAEALRWVADGVQHNAERRPPAAREASA